MYVRVVRFTDVEPDRLQAVLERINASGGPPEGVPATGLRILVDEGQRTAVVEQHYATAEDMETGGRVLAAMDPGETPGTRVSVDTCEVKGEWSA